MKLQRLDPKHVIRARIYLRQKRRRADYITMRHISQDVVLQARGRGMEALKAS
jgi:hypothetical protein